MTSKILMPLLTLVACADRPCPETATPETRIVYRTKPAEPEAPTPSDQAGLSATEREALSKLQAFDWLTEAKANRIVGAVVAQQGAVDFYAMHKDVVDILWQPEQELADHAAHSYMVMQVLIEAGITQEPPSEDGPAPR